LKPLSKCFVLNKQIKIRSMLPSL